MKVPDEPVSPSIARLVKTALTLLHARSGEISLPENALNAVTPRGAVTPAHLPAVDLLPEIAAQTTPETGR